VRTFQFSNQTAVYDQEIFINHEKNNNKEQYMKLKPSQQKRLKPEAAHFFLPISSAIYQFPIP